MDVAFWNKAKVVGRHAASYTAGAVTFAAAWGLLSATDASSLNENIGLVTDGAKKIAQGIAGIIAVLTPIYSAWRGIRNVDPHEQLKSITALPEHEVAAIAGNIDDREARNKLINAVGTMPEVSRVVATPSVARATDSPKVVTS